LGFSLYDGLGDGGKDLWERWQAARSPKNVPATPAKTRPIFANVSTIAFRTVLATGCGGPSGQFEPAGRLTKWNSMGQAVSGRLLRPD
jgi:hypothetical protein